MAIIAQPGPGNTQKWDPSNPPFQTMGPYGPGKWVAPGTPQSPTPTPGMDWWNGSGYSARPQSGVDQDNALKAYWASNPPAPITDTDRQNAAFAGQQPMGHQKISNQDMTYGQYWQQNPQTAPNPRYFTNPEENMQPGAVMAGAGAGRTTTAAPRPTPQQTPTNLAARTMTTPGYSTTTPGSQAPGAATNPIQNAMSQYQNNLRSQVPQQYQQYLPANFGF